jgi:hypothetical protein
VVKNFKVEDTRLEFIFIGTIALPDHVPGRNEGDGGTEFSILRGRGLGVGVGVGWGWASTMFGRGNFVGYLFIGTNPSSDHVPSLSSPPPHLRVSRCVIVVWTCDVGTGVWKKGGEKSK